MSNNTNRTSTDKKVSGTGFISPKKASALVRKIAGVQLKLLAINKIEIDHEHYQREEKTLHVNNITEGWSEDLFSPPTIIHRMTGIYVAVDGQQRLAAARRLGYTHVWVRLLVAKTVEDEARLFTLLNLAPKKLQPRDLYKANLTWGESVVAACEKVLNAHELTALHVGGPREVTAIVALREAWGHAALKIGVKLTDKQMTHGIATLHWVLNAGQPQLDKGESANAVFSASNLGALIWIYRNALNDVDLATIQALIGRTTSAYLRDIIGGPESNRSGSQRSRGGARLAKWFNETAQATVVELPDDAWSEIEND